MCRWDTEAVRELRGTVYRGDGSVVEIVRGRLTDDVLQMAGDGLLDAVAQGVNGAVELASTARRRCGTGRGWETTSWLTRSWQL